MLKRSIVAFIVAVMAAASGYAQTPVGTVVSIPFPDDNAFWTSLRYDAGGNLYAWDGLSVWQQSGGVFHNLGAVTSGTNAADTGPITFSQDGQTMLLSNGAGGFAGGALNGVFWTMPNGGGTAARVAGGGVPYASDALALPATSTIPGSSTKYLVYEGSPTLGGSTSLSIFDAASGTNRLVIANTGAGATASIAINPTNNRIYLNIGFGANQGKIYSFSMSQIDAAYTSGSPLDFFADGVPFNRSATGYQNGSGMFFDQNGYLLSGGDGITTFAPDGTIYYNRPGDGSWGYDSLVYDPATNRVLKLPGGASGGILYDAADFEPAFWKKAEGGSWGLDTNWSGRPLTTGAVLVFANSTAGTAVVTLDGSRSAYALQFGGSSSASNYAITSGIADTLTLGTTAAAPAIAVFSGTQTISAPILLEGNLAVSASAGTRLNLVGNIDQDAGVSAALSLSGDGRLVLSGTNNLGGGVTIAGGTLEVLHAYSLPDGADLTVDSLGTFANAPIVPSVVSQGLATVPEPSGLAIALATGFFGLAVCPRGYRRVRH